MKIVVDDPKMPEFKYQYRRGRVRLEANDGSVYYAVDTAAGGVQLTKDGSEILTNTKFKGVSRAIFDDEHECFGCGEVICGLCPECRE